MNRSTLGSPESVGYREVLHEITSQNDAAALNCTPRASRTLQKRETRRLHITGNVEARGVRPAFHPNLSACQRRHNISHESLCTYGQEVTWTRSNGIPCSSPHRGGPITSRFRSIPSTAVEIEPIPPTIHEPSSNRTYRTAGLSLSSRRCDGLDLGEHGDYQQRCRAGSYMDVRVARAPLVAPP